MMTPYSLVAIIYNPKSTGSGERLARQLERKLAARLSGQSIQLIPTQHAGHAEELAYKLAVSSPNPLIISSSGDGGYHEVVNGLMKAIAEGAKPVSGLLPAGNANDHYKDLHSTKTVDAIADQAAQYIDVLELSTTVGGKPYRRYAHSYIGVGLTPEAGLALNNAKLKWLNEIWIVAKVLLFLSSVRLVVHGEVHHYDSLVFSNVSKMSKILKLSSTAMPDDGKFEVTAYGRRNKVRFIASLIRATTLGSANNKHVTEFSFGTLTPTLLQLDGETLTIDANCTTHIKIVPAVLRCIV